MVVLYQTWPTFVYRNQLLQYSIHSLREIKILWKKSRRCCWWSIYRIYTKGSCWWNSYSKFNKLMQIFCWNWYWPVTPTPTRCVNPCWPVFIRVGILIHRQIDSHLDKIKLVALKTRSCTIFNEKDQIAKWKASIQQADWKKLTASLLMGFVPIATLFLKLWMLLSLFSLSRSSTALTEWDIQRGSKKRELDDLGWSYVREKSYTVI